MIDSNITNIIIFTVIVYGAAAFVIWFAIRRKRRHREKRDSAFIAAILSSVRNQTIASIDDIYSFYKTYYDILVLGVLDHQRIGQFLRSAIMRVSSADQKSIEFQLRDHLPLMRDLLSANQKALEQEEERIPFSGTPSPERQLLEDILELTSSDRTIVRTKLYELARSIIARDDTVEKLGEEGRRSLKWAKWGVAGTVFFSLVSIGLAIWALSK